MELTELEQFILIQIFDQSWKDHLYAMDMLKGGVGLSGFAEQDPRIVFKKEGYGYFLQMMAGVGDKVTDLLFRPESPAQRRPAAPTAKPPRFMRRPAATAEGRSPGRTGRFRSGQRPAGRSGRQGEDDRSRGRQSRPKRSVSLRQRKEV